MFTISNIIKYCNTGCFSRYFSKKNKENGSETTEIYQVNEKDKQDDSVEASCEGLD
jgi:hypothetical protein